jgi:carbonic anhydrase
MGENELPGPAGVWLRPLRAIYEERAEFFAKWPEQASWDKLCELNVIAQVYGLGHMPVIRDAWRRGQELAIHGWIYDLRDGRLQDLNVTITSEVECAGISLS